MASICDDMSPCCVEVTGSEEPGHFAVVPKNRAKKQRDRRG